MESFHWNKSFETGFSEVDQQHHHLVELINKFGEMLTNNEVLFEDIEREILSITDSLKLIRFDNSPQGNTLVMLINPNKETSIDQISSKLKLLDKDMEFTFFESKTNW